MQKDFKQIDKHQRIAARKKKCFMCISKISLSKNSRARSLSMVCDKNFADFTNSYTKVAYSDKFKKIL